MPNSLNLSALNVSHLDQYFGVWAIQQETFQAAVDRVLTLNLVAHVADRQALSLGGDETLFAYEMMGSTAVLSLTGPLMKYASSLTGGTSTVAARRQIRKAGEDAVVQSILLRVDSPGGTLSGTQDLADDIAAVAGKKPVYAFIEDLGASAAYWLASQATKVFANRTAMVGSIGTFAVLNDTSAQANQAGVKVHVIKAGDHKGAGVPGTEVTADQLAEWQRLINQSNEHFLKAVAQGRGVAMGEIRKLADGRVHLAAEAKQLGLLDGVQSFDQTLSQLQTKKRSATKMEKTPATLAELKTTFTKSTADWRESQIEAGASLSEAAVAYAKHVEAQADADRTKHAEALKAAEAKGDANTKKAGGSLGHEPLKAGKQHTAAPLELETEGDAIEDFNAAVSQLAGRSPDLKRRQQAIRAVANQRPDLYQAYLLATNPGKRQSRLITEKLEGIGN